ncbi:hypothetical protein [Escherichia coli]|uniref:hypothetical protein n=1 Tax=Escherichia coli TaxID=562 RepID=UPI000BB7BEBB|nr:hypothetical protein [Escherichia coli]EFI4461783.1 hypothetical protein [Escherichia coli]EFJ2237366.1 hypothetical protein [Escherichia coli]MDM4874531.1 hypothetical protein [Escherichia coli]MDM4977272.1 hypothetical protein [Escherichia coli]MDM5169671.1 hypothetical protein [Escherichia coli]
MNGFRNRSRSSKVWCWQRAGGRAVILEVSGRGIEAAEAWIRAAHIAPRTDWQQFAWQRAEYCQRRSRGKAGHPLPPEERGGCPAKIKEHTRQVG